ncbi:MAG TPA: response regulator transcription factor [Ktedonobacterales bacterium]|jgi:DNA-binding response OmpR family regulator
MRLPFFPILRTQGFYRAAAMRILVVDDEPISTKLVHFILSEEGYDVTSVDSPRGAMAMIQRQLPDLILLDVNMPQMNGFVFHKHLRENDYDIPVIFVTAKGELEDKLNGLRQGADDYIVKPFDPAELLARVQAVLRRYRKATAQASEKILRAGEFELNMADLQMCLPDKRTVLLTPREMKIMLILAGRVGQILRREELLDAIWGENYPGESNIVDVYIRRLRRKIEHDPANPQYIQSARGVGYKFVGK